MIKIIREFVGSFGALVAVVVLGLSTLCSVQNSQAKDMARELVRSCTFDRLEQVKQLLDRGADVNATDNFGRTPLREAAAKLIFDS